MSGGIGGANASGAAHQMQSFQSATGTIQRPAHAKEYHFLDIELKYGILQVSSPARPLNGIMFHSFLRRRQKASRIKYPTALFVCTEQHPIVYGVPTY